ncbi:NAD(P)-binding protein [Aspergillus steynii IBT 23096]|uniref:NAD(P)-binding protein n=1 Tax=Aspergillus steynii IBT 23096 TaxID=1392250 RepID=A0A2I2GAM8_9EURO|nr:NAD(P)-binding protein [Aspergillus steynii IBT 23096]PLB49918.1 NAD(P)-binding protein [Aspergillus steynii IBT 23096]
MEFHINPDDLPSLAGKTILITGTPFSTFPLESPLTPSTGTNSGIGLSTTHFLLSHGANVIAGDISASPPPSLPNPNLTPSTPQPKPGTLFYQPTNVTEWSSIRALFEKGHEHFGRIDHVFANAGIRPQSNFLEETFDEDGLLAPPNLGTVDVNLIGVVNTLRLAVYYLKRGDRPQSQQSESPSNGEHIVQGKSIILSASGASLRNFWAADYATAKHGVLGLIRGLTEDTTSLGGVRLNAVAPSWTDTGMVPKTLLESVGARVQDAVAVARAVATLFGDDQRHGQLVYIWDGRYFELNSSKGGMLDSVDRMLPEMVSEGEAMVRLRMRSLESRVTG